MKRKYKMTGCARFFIALIILAPLAYIGASYYNGEDGIERFKNLIGLGDKDEVSDDTLREFPGSSKNTDSGNQDQSELIESLQKENAQLQRELREMRKELEEVKKNSSGGAQDGG